MKIGVYMNRAGVDELIHSGQDAIEFMQPIPTEEWEPEYSGEKCVVYMHDGAGLVIALGSCTLEEAYSEYADWWLLENGE